MLPDGSCELLCHGVDSTIEYLPKFALAQFPTLAFSPLVKPDGLPLPRRFIGMQFARSGELGVNVPAPTFREKGDLLLAAVDKRLGAWVYCFRNVAVPEEK